MALESGPGTTDFGSAHLGAILVTGRMITSVSPFSPKELYFRFFTKALKESDVEMGRRYVLERIGASDFDTSASPSAARHCGTQGRADMMRVIVQLAPLLMREGVWLYGAIRCPLTPAFEVLGKAYLFRLGGGRKRHNPVLLYQRLLNGMNKAWQNLPSFKRGEGDNGQQPCVECGCLS